MKDPLNARSGVTITALGIELRSDGQLLACIRAGSGFEVEYRQNLFD